MRCGCADGGLTGRNPGLIEGALEAAVPHSLHTDELFLAEYDGLPADGTGIYTAGPYKGLQAHTNFILEQRSWVHAGLDTEIPPPQYPKDQFVQDMKAGIAHWIVPSVNLEIYQDAGVGDASLEYMKAVKQEVKGRGSPMRSD